MEIKRLIAYIDGFNLYFGLKDKGWKRYYWLNLQLLMQNLLKPSQQLIETKYFTARVNTPPDKVKRQSIYIDTLYTLPDFQIFFGKYMTNVRRCNNCGYEYLDSKEKMTDINIAVEMISDAFRNKFDTALLISADSDLTPVVKLVKKFYPDKRITIGFPPSRHSRDLESVADANFHIGRGTLAKSVFPNTVMRKDGFPLIKPPEWQ